MKKIPTVKVTASKGIPKKRLEEIKKKPGMSNAGKYSGLPSSEFAGPNGTYPINTPKRARNALSRAHFSSEPQSIRKKVLSKYPELKKK